MSSVFADIGDMRKQPAPNNAVSATPATLPRLLTLKQLRTNLTISRTTVWRAVRLGTFPAPLQLTPTRIAWRETDVLAWLAAREAGGRHGIIEIGRR